MNWEKVIDFVAGEASTKFVKVVLPTVGIFWTLQILRVLIW